MEGEWRPRCRHTFSFLNLKQEMNSKINGLAKRVLWLLLLFVTGQSAFASKIYIEDFSIGAGQSKEIPVYFDVTEGAQTGSIQFIVQLPSNLTLDDVTLNTSRMGRKYSTQLTAGTRNRYQILILRTTTTAAIPQGEGVLCTLKVTASEAYDGVGGKVIVSGVEVTNLEDNSLFDEEELTAGSTSNVVANIDLSGDDVEVTAVDGTTEYDVYVNLAGTVSVYGLQAVVTLPEGLSFVEDPEEEDPTPLFLTTNRSNRFTPYSNFLNEEKTVAKIAYANLGGTAMTGTEGAILSFKVVANENLAENSVITVSDIVASQKDGVASMAVDGFEIKVINNSVPTSIESAPASASASEVVGIYTLTGQKVSSVEKGQVYLLKSANGTTAKVLVK